MNVVGCGVNRIKFGGGLVCRRLPGGPGFSPKKFEKLTCQINILEPTGASFKRKYHKRFVLDIRFY